MWPFRRRRKKHPRPQNKGTAPRARARGKALREARVQGRTQATRRKKYVPPPAPSHPGFVPARHRAPDGPAVWAWLKQAPPDYFVEAWTEGDPDGYEDLSKWPRAELPRGITAIRRHVLSLVLEASKAQYPNEFGGLLRVEKGVIEELILAPGTEGGATAAIFQLNMLPVDLSIVGTIHSHPSPVPYPSAADTALFERYGRIHIITGHPFGPQDWRAFDHRSRLVPLRVVA